MNSIAFNAAVLPIFAIMLIPNAIRNRKSGVYLGYLNINVFVYLVIIFALETFFLIDKFGFGIITLLRIVGITAMPFIGAYVFVKYSHKENYGVEFNRKKRNGSP